MQKYLSLVKFSHTVFALPFALVGLTLGFAQTNHFDPRILVFVLLCMVTARTAAMAFNRWLDRDIDAANPRTAIREIPAGKISPNQALGLTVLSSLSFVFSAWFINPLCFYLSPVALLVVLGYSYTKRFTALCHLVLGVGLGLAPVGAYIAVTEQFSLAPVLLGFAVLAWVSGFDIIYALQDEEFDRRMGLKSIPAMLGTRQALWVSRSLHIVSVLLVAAFGYLIDGGLLFWVGFLVYTTLLLRQHGIVKNGDLSRVNLAFFTLNGIASVVFGSFAIAGIIYQYWF
jgi:4-hydroxybenzoate polyprenyltransferase